MRERAHSWLPVLVALGLTAIGNWRFTIYPSTGFLLAKWWWGAALSILLVGAALADDGADAVPRPPWRRLDLLALLSILLAAAVFWLWDFAGYPSRGGFASAQDQTG